MGRLAVAALALVLAAPAAMADEFEETLEGALAAYRAGDIGIARQDLDYALRLLGDINAAELADLLPEPLPGWAREIEPGPEGAALAFFGGGTMVSASYLRGADEFTLSLMADSPMVSGMAAMFSGMAVGAGRAVRIQRQQFAVSEGEIQGVVGGRVLVQAEGSAAVADMQAHIEAMDLGALADW
ncbi:hypothetical protein BH23PSE1_BH23PSE1_02300 [soil metagenome]